MPTPQGDCRQGDFGGAKSTGDAAGRSVAVLVLCPTGGVADLEELGGQAAEGPRHVPAGTGDSPPHLADRIHGVPARRLDRVLAYTVPRHLTRAAGFSAVWRHGVSSVDQVG